MQTANDRSAFALKASLRSLGYARRWASLMLVGFILSSSTLQAQNSLEGIGDLPGGGFQSLANDVSSNGLVVVGVSATPTGAQPFRWTVTDKATMDKKALSLELVQEVLASSDLRT